MWCFVCRASENHMTRVQELGRLCRYPAASGDCTTELPSLEESLCTCADVENQLTSAFVFASGQNSRLHMPTCRQILLSLCDAAQDVFAFANWMRSNRSRQSGSEGTQNLQTLRDLVQKLNSEVICLLHLARHPHNTPPAASTILTIHCLQCWKMLCSSFMQLLCTCKHKACTDLDGLHSLTMLD